MLQVPIGVFAKIQMTCPSASDDLETIAPLRKRNRAYREVCSVGEVRAQKARWCLGVQTWSLFRSISLVGGNRCVRELQSPPLAVTYHSLDRIEQVTSRRIWITESARYLKVVPGNPKRIFNQYWHRFRHEAKTPLNFPFLGQEL